MNHDAELAARLYQPSAASMVKHLPDMGQGLAVALVELSRNPTPWQCDEMLHRLQAASHAVARLRAALVSEGAP